MAARYKFYPHHRITVFEFSGDFTTDECLETLKCYLLDPQYDPDYELVLDMTNADSTDSTFSQMEKLVHQITSSIPKSNRSICVLIAISDLLFGAARMYQLLMEDKVTYPIKIARSRAEALTMLGIDGVDFDVLDRLPPENYSL